MEPTKNKNSMKPYVIAECAQGFEGVLTNAIMLVKAAAASKADAVKFQLVYADELATPDYKYYQLFKSLEMTDHDWGLVAQCANENNINLQLDIFGEQSLMLAEKLNVDAIKIHPTDVSNKRLLNYVSKSKINKIVLGVGGAYKEEISIALEILKNKELILLFGFQSYPTSTEDNKVSRIKIAIDHFSNLNLNLRYGFADHANPSDNIHLGIAAAAMGMGATVVEKHLTIAKSMKMEDYESALNPDEFLEYVNFVNACSQAIGSSSFDNDFNMSNSEKSYREMISRQVVALCTINKGELVDSNNIALKRTSYEVALTSLSEIEGKRAKEIINENEPIQPQFIA